MHRATRPAALMLSLLLVHTAAPVRAAGLRASQVAPVMTTAGGGEVQLRLRNTSQLDNSVLSDRVGAQEPQSAQGQTTTTAAGTGAGATAQSASGPTVETIQIGEVSGTICDCGEIPIIGGGGGFPLGFFPLFALGALPLAFIDFGGDNETVTRVDVPTPTPIPTPAPTPTAPIPEPATLLLFGTGLAAIGARVRRRRQGEKNSSIEASAPVAGEEV